EHAVPAIGDIAGSAPQIAGLRRPLPGAIGTPFTDTEDNGTPRRREGIPEPGVLRRGIEPLGIAPIFFDVVHAPFGVGAPVLLFVSVGAGPALAGAAAGVGVDAELETLLVYVVGERLDAAGEAHRIGDDPSGGIPRHLPAVVDHDVPITRVAEAARHHGVGS